MFESYSQIGEDMIARYYLRDRPKGRYVDVGAEHPIEFSNTFAFYRDGWTGTLIEPLAERWEMLMGVRSKDELFKGACGPNEFALLHVMTYTVLSTTSQQAAGVWMKNDPAIKVERTQAVPMKPLRDFMAPSVDLVSVDTEGTELEVLQTHHWLGEHRPTIVIVETKDYSSSHRSEPEITAFMKAKGYQVLADTGLNTIYCPDELKWW